MSPRIRHQALSFALAALLNAALLAGLHGLALHEGAGAPSWGEHAATAPLEA